jgi:hypothetical protein
VEILTDGCSGTWGGFVVLGRNFCQALSFEAFGDISRSFTILGGGFAFYQKLVLLDKVSEDNHGRVCVDRMVQPWKSLYGKIFMRLYLR